MKLSNHVITTAVAAVAAVASASSFAATPSAPALHSFTGSGAPYIARYERAVSGARMVKIRLYTLITQHLPTGGEHSVESNFEFERGPGKLRAEIAGPAATILIVGEGKNFWLYNRKTNKYEKLPESAVAQIQAQAVQSSNVFPEGSPTEWTYNGVHAVSGHPCDVVSGEGTIAKETLYLDHTTHLPRRAEISRLVGGATATSLMVFSTFEINAAIPESTYQWTPPAGATEVQPGQQ